MANVILVAVIMFRIHTLYQGAVPDTVKKLKVYPAKQDATRTYKVEYRKVEKILGETYPVPKPDKKLVTKIKNAEQRLSKEAQKDLKTVVTIPAYKLPLAKGQNYVTTVTLPTRSDSFLHSIIKNKKVYDAAVQLRSIPYGYFFAYEDDTLAYHTYLSLVDSLGVFALPVLVSRTERAFDLRKEPFRFGEWWQKKLGFQPEVMTTSGWLNRFKITRLPAFVFIKDDKARVYYGYH